jgi:NADPH:quinone reductase-like Zn-dependent oxidoreductase
MKAVIYTEYGPPSVLKITEWERPRPKNHEILVRVKASTVSAGVIWVRQGQYPGSWLFTFLLRLFNGIRRPKHPILGYEFSGVVEAIGAGVSSFKPGDEVYGTTTGLDNGAYAEYLCVPEKWKLGVVKLKPQSLGFKEAAALPVGGMTALQLLQKTGLKKGQRVLIYGASGSVGTYAVQIAKYWGANVSAACSPSNGEWIRNLGAEAILDYHNLDFLPEKEKFDVVFDAVGKFEKRTLKLLLKKRGTFSSVKSLTRESLEMLEALEKMVEAGALNPVIDCTYALDEIVAAHEYVDLGHKKGNVVVICDASSGIGDH